jgi:hypothetical protein
MTAVHSDVSSITAVRVVARLSQPLLRLVTRPVLIVESENRIRACQRKGVKRASSLLVFRSIKKIRLATGTNAWIKNPVTPAKAGAHGKTGSRPSPGRQGGRSLH